MEQIKAMKTKAGKGLKIVVGNKWFYTSLQEFSAMLTGDANACTFRTIEGNGGQQQ